MSTTRIVFLVPDLLGAQGGIARHCRVVCQALLADGVGVHVIALHDEPPLSRTNQELFPGMEYNASAGSRVNFILRALLALRCHPDIVLIGHAHFSAIGWVLARLSKAKLVIFAHGIEVWSPLTLSRRVAFRHADCILCVSNFTAQQVIQANAVASTKIQVLYNCLDPHFIGEISRDASDASTPRLLTVARILKPEQYKGHDYVIRALPTLRRDYPDLDYSVVGIGEGIEELRALAIREGVADIVRFQGAVSESQLSDQYKSASLFVMPSRREGFGFVFLEAMAHGLPIVAGNQDATIEVVENGKTGILIDPGDLSALIEAIDQLLRDPALRGRMGKLGRQIAFEKFGFDQFKDRLRALLLELL